MFSICLVRQNVTVEIQFGMTIYYVIIVAGVILTFVSLCVMVSIFKTSHALIRPLRILNTKMKEVMMEDGRGGMNQTSLTANKESSYEISQLYDVFKDLIQDK